MLSWTVFLSAGHPIHKSVATELGVYFHPRPSLMGSLFTSLFFFLWERLMQSKALGKFVVLVHDLWNMARGKWRREVLVASSEREVCTSKALSTSSHMLFRSNRI